MRFRTGNVKFVAVDEPSSALDAEGEFKLFEKLIGVREGKTVVFVTHRFGHLTKHADQIMYVYSPTYTSFRTAHPLSGSCMKDGLIVEQGKHDELMKNGGEYAKLYEIQAGAFSKS